MAGGKRRAHSGLAGCVAEIEAISSLANYAYEHPADVFPEFVAGEPVFDVEAVGHPLLPERALRTQQRAARIARAAVRRQRFQYVGQEHAAARGRSECGARAGRRAGSRAAADAFQSLGGRVDPDDRFARRRPVAIHGGDSAIQTDPRTAAARAIPAG